jgi:hypothetical protein
MAYTGIFKPQNPNKYKGDPTKIIYRSRWELILMGQFDANPDVLEWSSEEIVIPYRSPIDGKIHRYFPDFWIKKRNASDRKIVEVLIEVKPKAQTVPPKPQSKVTKRYLTEVQTWGINSAKWAAAEEVCRRKGWSFVKITEDDLGLTF